jgi:hypothetical protein
MTAPQGTNRAPKNATLRVGDLARGTNAVVYSANVWIPPARDEVRLGACELRIRKMLLDARKRCRAEFGGRH